MGVLVFCAVLRLLGAVLRLCGYTVVWFYGYAVLRLYGCWGGYTVVWFYGYTVVRGGCTVLRWIDGGDGC